MPVVAALSFSFLVAAGVRPAWAAFSPKDGQVLGRTLGFVGDGGAAEAVVGVVFAPEDARSRRDADGVRLVIGEALQAGRLRLRAKMVTLRDMASVSGVDALYITPGLAGSAGEIASAVQRLHVPTVSAGMDCVMAGLCMVGFSSEPSVQIVVDQSAAAQAGVHFRRAFLMLVKER
jgi:hypothetical protein